MCMLLDYPQGSLWNAWSSRQNYSQSPQQKYLEPQQCEQMCRFKVEVFR